MYRNRLHMTCGKRGYSRMLPKNTRWSPKWVIKALLVMVFAYCANGLTPALSVIFIRFTAGPIDQYGPRESPGPTKRPTSQRNWIGIFGWAPRLIVTM